MVVAHDAGLLAVSALISAGSGLGKRKCRAILVEAVDRLESPNATHKKAKDAASCIRLACMACGRCRGV